MKTQWMKKDRICSLTFTGSYYNSVQYISVIFPSCCPPPCSYYCVNVLSVNQRSSPPDFLLARCHLERPHFMTFVLESFSISCPSWRR